MKINQSEIAKELSLKAGDKFSTHYGVKVVLELKAKTVICSFAGNSVKDSTTYNTIKENLLKGYWKKIS